MRPSQIWRQRRGAGVGRRRPSRRRRRARSSGRRGSMTERAPRTSIVSGARLRRQRCARRRLRVASSPAPRRFCTSTSTTASSGDDFAVRDVDGDLRSGKSFPAAFDEMVSVGARSSALTWLSGPRTRTRAGRDCTPANSKPVRQFAVEFGLRLPTRARRVAPA